MFCYIQPGTTKHCRLWPSHLGIWATAIVNRSATLTCPPRNPEIDAAINGHRKLKEQQPSTSNNPTVVPIYLPPFTEYHRDSLQKKRRRQRAGEDVDELNSSPIGNYQPCDYNKTALEAYTSWCANKFGDHEFVEAFPQLQKHKIGVDLIEDIELDILTKVCGISHGTSVRLKKSFAKWKATL